MNYRAYVSIGEYETPEEALEAVLPFEKDGASSIIKQVEEAIQ